MAEDQQTPAPTEPTEPTEPTAPAAPAAPAFPPPAAPAEVTAPAASAVVPVAPGPGGFFWGTGRRKASVARVRIKAGQGRFLINGRPIDNYFSEIRDRQDIVAPLAATDTRERVDVLVKVHGGGYTGQAGAIRLGVSRALKNYDGTLEPALREHGMLSRDPRRVERKKYGQPGARKRFQFSKR